MPSPQYFYEVPGWRDQFRAAAERLDIVRTGSLFPEIPLTLCGQRVRALTLADWTLLEHAQNPLFVGGQCGVEHAAGLIWVLSPEFRRDCKISRFWRAWKVYRVMRWANYDEMAVINAVMAFVDDAFLDAPGHFDKSSKPQGKSAVNWSRKAMEIELCAEVMTEFPAFSHAYLRKMPLAQFWQWLHEARSQFCSKNKLDKYRNFQLTDQINQEANDEVNRIRREERERAELEKKAAQNGSE